MAGSLNIPEPLAPPGNRGWGERAGAGILALSKPALATIIFFVLIICLVGCGSNPPPKQAEAPKPKDKIPKDVPTNFNVGKGNIVFNDPKEQRPQWKMAWESARVQVGDGKNSQTADAKGVSGDIIRDGKTVAIYHADTGKGDRDKQLLELGGAVIIESTVYKATLTCAKVVYDANLKLFKASGGVEVMGEAGTIRTQELWASSDLKTVATPELFKKS